MGKRIKPSMRQLEKWRSQKTAILSKAQALAAVGMADALQPLWTTAAELEERIASLLDAHGEALEAAVHRISATSCHQKAGDRSRAANMFRAALAGPLREPTRKDVEQMLAECFALLAD
jgi:hypothetical protein